MHRKRLLHNIVTQRMGSRLELKRGSEIAFNIQPDSTLTLSSQKNSWKKKAEATPPNPKNTT
jgi:hypothetical protein